MALSSCVAQPSRILAFRAQDSRESGFWYSRKRRRSVGRRPGCGSRRRFNSLPGHDISKGKELVAILLQPFLDLYCYFVLRGYVRDMPIESSSSTRNPVKLSSISSSCGTESNGGSLGTASTIINAKTAEQSSRPKRNVGHAAKTKLTPCD